MKTLILATAAIFFMAGGIANAADDTNMRSMTRAECELAMAACKDDACKDSLKNNNGCDYPAPTQ